MKEKLSEFEEQYGNWKVTCPYCQYIYEIPFSLLKDYDDSNRCLKCNNIYHLKTKAHLSTVSTPNCELNNLDHQFKNIGVTITGIRKLCEVCGFRKTEMPEQ